MKNEENSVTQLIEALDDLHCAVNTLITTLNSNKRLVICEESFKNYMQGHQPEKVYVPEFRTPSDFVPLVPPSNQWEEYK